MKNEDVAAAVPSSAGPHTAGAQHRGSASIFQAEGAAKGYHCLLSLCLLKKAMLNSEHPCSNKIFNFSLFKKTTVSRTDWNKRTMTSLRQHCSEAP